MQRLIWLVMPVLLFGCIWERDHDRRHSHYPSWGYYPDDEPHAHHSHEDKHASRRDVDACVSEGDEDDASVAESEFTPAADAGELRCQSDSDCEDMTYCEQDTGACLPGVTCEDESSCEPGFNCDPERSVCVPADMERCREMADEAACAERNDCMTTYAGINCSCGPDCTCMGGEPNCVCERFEFHICEDALDTVE